MPHVQINYLAVVVVAVLNMGVGALWYSPLLFAKKWMALTGKSAEEMKEGMRSGAARKYLLTLLASLVASYVLARFVGYAQATTIVRGALIGFLAWVGFVVTTSSGSVIFEGRKGGLYTLNNAFHLVSLVIMGAILAIWR